MWKDPRLAYDKLNSSSIPRPSRNLSYTTLWKNAFTLGYEFKRRIWSPDLFTPQLKKNQLLNLLTPNVVVRLSSDGKVLLSQK